MLAASSQLFVALLKVSADSLIVTNEFGAIEWASDSVAWVFGYSPQELEGREISSLLPEVPSGSARRLSDHVSEMNALNGDLPGRRRDGSTFPADVRFSSLQIEEGRYVGALVRDMTVRRRHEDLLLYVNEISRSLLSGTTASEVLRLAAGKARYLVDASAAWIVTRKGSGLSVVAADGRGEGLLEGAGVPEQVSHTSRVMRGMDPVLIADMSRDETVIFEARDLDLGPGIYLPMRDEHGPMGVLVVARGSGAPAFTKVDIDALEVFASAAAVVISQGRMREELSRLQLVTEYDRIARDLHDTVIQRLFALGMSLQAVERHLEGYVAERVRAGVDSIDEVIREIRRTIFDLNRLSMGDQGEDIRSQIEDLVVDTSEKLGFTPRIVFKGPVASAVSPELVPDLLAVARESLANVAKHSQAERVDMVLEAGGGSVSLSVVDDGVGPSGRKSPGNGLANMSARARKFGGEFSLEPGERGGTVLTWRVPYATA